jgi:hypothetical protein
VRRSLSSEDINVSTATDGKMTRRRRVQSP